MGTAASSELIRRPPTTVVRSGRPSSARRPAEGRPFVSVHGVHGSVHGVDRCTLGDTRDSDAQGWSWSWSWSWSRSWPKAEWWFPRAAVVVRVSTVVMSIAYCHGRRRSRWPSRVGQPRAPANACGRHAARAHAAGGATRLHEAYFRQQLLRATVRWASSAPRVRGAVGLQRPFVAMDQATEAERTTESTMATSPRLHSEVRLRLREGSSAALVALL